MKFISLTLSLTGSLQVSMLFLMAIAYCINTSNEVARSNLSSEQAFTGYKGFGGFFTSMVACLWAFDGW